MERYATPEDYRRLCPENPIEEDTLLESRLLEAQRDIDSLTYCRIRAVGFRSLPQWLGELVTQAVCLQAQFLQCYGGMLLSPLASYGVNGVSMSFDKGRLLQRGGVTAPARVGNLLDQTGLTCSALDKSWRRCLRSAE